MPVPDACDAADDPAVWVDEADLEASLIVATNKPRGLVVYGLDGAVVSTNDIGRVNNVDQRDGVDVGGKQEIVLAATDRTIWTIDVLSLDRDSGALTPLLDSPISPDFRSSGQHGAPRVPQGRPVRVQALAGGRSSLSPLSIKLPAGLTGNSA